MTTTHPRMGAAVSRLSWLECRVRPVRNNELATLAKFDAFFVRPDLVWVELSKNVVEPVLSAKPQRGHCSVSISTHSHIVLAKSRTEVAQALVRLAQHDAALAFAPATKSNGDGSARSPFTLTSWRTAFSIVRRQIYTNVIHSCPTRTPDTLARFPSVMTTIQRTFRAEERLILDAEALAHARGITLSDVVRVALRSELERNYEARLTKLASELGATDYAECKEMEGTLGDGLENHPA